MSVIGMDFGGLNSSVAIARQGGIEIVTNDYGLGNIPSRVTFVGTCRMVDVAGKDQEGVNYKNKVVGFKEAVGRRADDPVVKKLASTATYKVTETRGGAAGIEVELSGERLTMSMEEVTSRLLAYLKQCAEKYAKAGIVDCVLSVPCFWTEAQRQALLDAAKGTGLKVLKLMDETTAVALNYGVNKQDLPDPKEKPRHVAFVDVGHSTTQATICQFHKGHFQEKAEVFDPNLGGRDLTAVIRDSVISTFEDEYKLHVTSNPRAMVRLTDECEKLKKQMSADSTRIPLNMEGFMEDKDVTGFICRSDFEDKCEHVWDRFEALMQSLLEQSKLTPADIHSVELVGGSTRVPRIQQIVKSVFGCEPSTTLNADDAVAVGCALQGAILRSENGPRSGKRASTEVVPGPSKRISHLDNWEQYPTGKRRRLMDKDVGSIYNQLQDQRVLLEQERAARVKLEQQVSDLRRRLAASDGVPKAQVLRMRGGGCRKRVRQRAPYTDSPVRRRQTIRRSWALERDRYTESSSEDDYITSSSEYNGPSDADTPESPPTPPPPPFLIQNLFADVPSDAEESEEDEEDAGGPAPPPAAPQVPPAPAAPAAPPAPAAPAAPLAPAAAPAPPAPGAPLAPAPPVAPPAPAAPAAPPAPAAAPAPPAPGAPLDPAPPAAAPAPAAPAAPPAPAAAPAPPAPGAPLAPAPPAAPVPAAPPAPAAPLAPPAPGGPLAPASPAAPAALPPPPAPSPFQGLESEASDEEDGQQQAAAAAPPPAPPAAAPAPAAVPAPVPAPCGRRDEHWRRTGLWFREERKAGRPKAFFKEYLVCMYCPSGPGHRPPKSFVYPGALRNHLERQCPYRPAIYR